MVSYATLCGLPAMLAVSVFGVAGLAGLGGRIGLGIAADRLGAKPVLVAGLLVQALAVGAYLFVSELKEFYALSVIFGLAYGGVMPLYAVLVRDFFGPHIMGTMFGAVSMFASLGMAFGPWAGGFVFDSYGSYAWLYLGSFAIGLAAVAIAQTFRPANPPVEQRLDLSAPGLTAGSARGSRRGRQARPRTGRARPPPSPPACRLERPPDTP